MRSGRRAQSLEAEVTCARKISRKAYTREPEVGACGGTCLAA